MKTRLALAGALAAAALSLASAAPVPADSRIAAVTVYTDRAVVTRSASLDLVVGAAEVTFDRLPANLVDQSLTASGRGTAQATILDVAVRPAYVDFTPNERVKALEDELRSLHHQRRVLDDRAAVLKAQDATLTRLETAATAAPTKDSAPRLSIEESAKLLAFLDDGRTKLATARQSLDTQLEDLAAKQSAAERQLNQVRGAGGKSYKTVTIRVDVATAGRLELVLSYAVPGASWTPNYDARVSSSERAVTLGYFGLVRQTTGEDWTDVSLTLSTARPSLGGAAPQIVPWAIDVVQFMPAPMPALRERRELMKGVANASPVNMQTLTSNTALEFPPPPAEKDAGFATAAVEAGTTSASFKLAATATVASDNSPQKVPITSAKLVTNPEYLTTPKKLTAAFLTAKVVNTSDFPLLGGAMSVFLDGTFVATSSLRTVMPGEKFDLALGADEGIAVKHKRVNRFTEDTGLTNSGKRVTYEYLVTIQNNKKSAERVIVADQVPVSRNEKIVVKVLAPAEKDVKPTADGTMKWTLDLKPGEKRELTLKFSVDYPNDVQVAGLD